MEDNIIKLYGLPRTGTNFLNLLLSLNFKDYICQDNTEHNVHFLGWKHGEPLTSEKINYIEKALGKKLKFVFTIRDFDEWQDAILKNHVGKWEFNYHFWDKTDKFIYSTPMGVELYDNIFDFYLKKNSIYENFVKENPNTSYIVNYKDLRNNCKEIIKDISNKLNLELLNTEVIDIKKKLDETGRLGDVFN